MSSPGLPGRVSGPLRWVLSPLDYRAHVLADGDQAVGGQGAVRCGAAGGLPCARSAIGPAVPAVRGHLARGCECSGQIRAHDSSLTLRPVGRP
jgi:hypothetical protein